MSLGCFASLWSLDRTNCWDRFSVFGVVLCHTSNSSSGAQPHIGENWAQACAGRVAFDLGRYPGLLDSQVVHAAQLVRMRSDLIVGLRLLRRCMMLSQSGHPLELASSLAQARLFLPCHPVLDALDRQTVTPVHPPD